ncbi:MAG: DNA repair protein RecN [Atribacterota bacterium]
MLKELVIKNFVIVDSQHILFGEGMNVITGETGTGKSLIIDALSLLKGGRTREDMIRREQKCAIIEGLFDLSHDLSIKHWLEDKGLIGEMEDEVVLTREILRDGKSRGRINGRSVPITALKDVSAFLVDIYGQNEHERFLASENQLNILDVFLDDQGKVMGSEYEKAFREMIQIQGEWEDLSGSDGEKLDDLREAVQEFERFQLDSENMGAVEDEFRMISGIQTYGEALDRFFQVLEGEEMGGGVGSLLAQMQGELERVPGEGVLQPVLKARDILKNIEIELQDVDYDLGRLRSSLDYSPEKIEQLERTVGEMERLKRKYRCRTTAELIGFRKDLTRKMIEAEEKETKQKKLEKELQERESYLFEKGRALAGKRREAAESLKKRLEAELLQLAFPRVEFEVVFEDISEEKPVFRSDGLDRCDFRITLNPGQKPGPIREVTSGGELSRIILGIKSIAVETENVPIMVFDEIDQGVSGKTAFWIGEKLKAISSGRQVICITHLPQIACFADQHLRVDKFSDAENTWAEVSPVEKRDERLKELVRMMGGESSSMPALQFAEILMERAGQ